MHEDAGTWALVLAAGDGTRLRSLTTVSSGSTIPKQYCSLHNGPSLLQEAVARAGAVASRERTCAVVAEQHRRWWGNSLSCLPRANVIAQPANRGTANGILLPLLHIVERDPDARVVLLPADHHVRREAVLAAALRKAVEQLDWRFDEILLLGLKPEEADPELGYIVPGRGDGRGALHVGQFIEKPEMAHARELAERGALWNVFIVAATARALLALLRRRMPREFAAMHAAVRNELRGEAGAVAGLYDRLPQLDFSRDILPGEEADLRVLPVPQCGWSDLGTPQRVAAALSQVAAPPAAAAAGIGAMCWSLAAQHARLNRCAT
ncbi:MAG TPA: sugar phosphate nucleotidyltransferase [Steroidobacteraceae bacterium]|nr:sugar phosphate nucleotidyltransferase [Steroidobacteraceae bacterium]